MNLSRAIELGAAAEETENFAVIVPRYTPAQIDATRNERNRLRQFAGWLDAVGGHWHTPDLAAYRDFLLYERAITLQAASVKAHISTVRARYRRLLRDPEITRRLYDLARADLSRMGVDVESPAQLANLKAYVDEMRRAVESAIHPDTAPVKTRVRQDRPDDEHLRLTDDQAAALMNAPGVVTLPGLRDTALIALMLCTGLRESEVCALVPRDLKQKIGGTLAIHVREGKGCKERLVPYGAVDWVLTLVEVWMEAAQITGGAVFRGFYKGGQSVRSTPLTTRAVQMILASYPIDIDGRRAAVQPHDCRRTYARRLYESGVDPVRIQQNLGHADLQTTLGYIGTLDVDQRRPPEIYPAFDLSKLGR